MQSRYLPWKLCDWVGYFLSLSGRILLICVLVILVRRNRAGSGSLISMETLYLQLQCNETRKGGCNALDEVLASIEHWILDPKVHMGCIRDRSREASIFMGFFTVILLEYKFEAPKFCLSFLLFIYFPMLICLNGLTGSLPEKSTPWNLWNQRLAQQIYPSACGRSFSILFISCWIPLHSWLPEKRMQLTYDNKLWLTFFNLMNIF